MNDSLGIGKIRGLQQIAGKSGVFNVAAIDHRGSLERGLCSVDGPECYAELVEFKMELCRALAPVASAVLLDPVYGAAQAIAGSVLPKGTGLLVSVEATGYEGDSTARVTRVLDGWGVEKIKRMGASAVKMLVYFRPDSGELAEEQLATVEKIALECVRFDIPFLVEPVAYPLEGETTADFNSKKTALVVETARVMTVLPIDVLKAEFPANVVAEDGETLMDACRQLDEASAKPWVILSGGAEYEIFRKEVEIACGAGASGFLAGRAIWQEAVSMQKISERTQFLATVAARRLKEISLIAESRGRPWYQKLGLSPSNLAAVDEGWHYRY
ncbi:tagatose 1,6-diphosphate aldolase [Dehalogenimonas etheniformans]|uniref:Tagatose 1,6-diphosphate aldolase n=1 Tax=Dehalogenimonas etheniformans TaxID=1536648 RepID=A0A2P5P8I5_9CHLR|nr:tagatose 1,6-diphosphate aldolase [Dehalogenimonas etheniformans]PPD58608.1 tagatose 1,6-diphosphate aldolase [Dehalogenimonas etheniformans]QNT76625.1 tagatose 1,6-diphosphate aldolase [Dehalogenimonas etheniformans]